MKHQITTIVTGGSSGLGYATTRQLIEAGFHVTIFDINEETGNQRIVEFGSEHCGFYKVDVVNAASVETAVQTLCENGFEIRILVNCAGIAPAKRILDRDANPTPLADFQRVIDINLVGTFNVCRVVASAMAKNLLDDIHTERGLIVNTASVAGYEGQIGQTAYAASKGGIIALCLPMARDLAPLGIRVNTIAPGVMGTPMLLAMPEKVQEALVHNVQFPKRLGLPEEFGKLVVHMYHNAYLNGETIRLDGALRMPAK